MPSSKLIFISICIVLPIIYDTLLVSNETVHIERSKNCVLNTSNQIHYVTFTSIISLLITMKLIPPISDLCVKAGLYGRDINKKGDSKIPESLGIVPGVVTLVAVISFQWFIQSSLGVFNAAMTSLCMMLLLGFADDVLDLRWSIKILLSLLATFPLLVAYDGPTNIIIPKPMRSMLGYDLDIGYFYHFCMAMISVFYTNSINIYAGINGLETGQSIIIGIEVLIHNYLQFKAGNGIEEHLLSIFIMLPFVMSSLGLFYFNSYPSSVFVGDTFTYGAGMALSVVGILGHFSKTLMLFFIPQLINFVLSLPQLLRIVPCPRHRLPKLQPNGKLLQYSPNYTLINAWLWLFGPTSEKSLCIQLLAFQVVCGLFAFYIRYQAAALFYDIVV